MNKVEKKQMRGCLDGMKLAYCQKWCDAGGKPVAYTIHANKQMWRELMRPTGDAGKEFNIRIKSLLRLGLLEAFHGTAMPDGRPYLCLVSTEFRSDLDLSLKGGRESRYCTVVRGERAPQKFTYSHKTDQESQEELRKKALSKLSDKERRSLGW